MISVVRFQAFLHNQAIVIIAVLSHYNNRPVGSEIEVPELTRTISWKNHFARLIQFE